MTDQRKSWRQREGCFSLDGEDDQTDSEPSLGSVAAGEYASQSNWTAGGASDLEDEHDGREDGADSEPSLGSATSGYSSDRQSQEAWAAGSTEDGEAEGPDEDLEPSLGSMLVGTWAHGGSDDLQKDYADSGIGDVDGLVEQVAGVGPLRFGVLTRRFE